MRGILNLTPEQLSWMVRTRAYPFKRDGQSRWVEDTVLGIRATYNFIQELWTIETWESEKEYTP